MGNIASGIDYKLHPDVVPHPQQKSNFDPLLGFPEGREEKKMIATEDELYSAKVPLGARTYCSHLLLKYLQCRKSEFPMIYKCHHEKHAYLNCEYSEYVDRMKDYERERRLMEREKRINQASAA